MVRYRFARENSPSNKNPRCRWHAWEFIRKRRQLMAATVVLTLSLPVTRRHQVGVTPLATYVPIKARRR